jgi:hypothetical protein
MLAKLYVDQSAVPDLAGEGVDLATRYQNMSVHRVNVDVQIEDVQPEVADLYGRRMAGTLFENCHWIFFFLRRWVRRMIMSQSRSAAS